MPLVRVPRTSTSRNDGKEFVAIPIDFDVEEWVSRHSSHIRFIKRITREDWMRTTKGKDAALLLEQDLEAGEPFVIEGWALDKKTRKSTRFPTMSRIGAAYKNEKSGALSFSLHLTCLFLTISQFLFATSSKAPRMKR